MSARLPEAFLRVPIAHRGLHDPATGVVENSLPALEAACMAGYGIEIDLQRSSDNLPMVFHDYLLDRLTPEAGVINARSAADLTSLPFRNGPGTIPTLAEVLTCVAGRVPLLVEIKDQDLAMGDSDAIGPLERAAALALTAYDGPVAVMSFNPHAVAAFAKAAPGIPVGRVTDPFEAAHWPGVSAARRAELARIDGLDGLDFISHRASDLTSQRVLDIRRSGLPVLCWTIRSAQEETDARAHADNITFEGYRPPPP